MNQDEVCFKMFLKCISVIVLLLNLFPLKIMIMETVFGPSVAPILSEKMMYEPSRGLFWELGNS